MAEFELVVPGNLAEALEAIARYGSDAAPLAGGTDLAVMLRSGSRAPRVVVWLGKVPELRGISRGAAGLTIGSAVTHARLAAHPDLGNLPVLTRAAASIGSPQVRNAGTAGGNLANASPAADLYPALLVLGAEVRLAGSGSARKVSLEDFVRGPGLTGLEPNEIIEGISLSRPWACEPPRGFFCDFAKVGLRNAVAISVASAAIAATQDGGKFAEIHIACGAVAPRPMRMRGVEDLLRGQALTPALLREAAAVAAGECDPITDIRASAGYRRRVAGVIVSRLIEAAWRSFAAGPGKGAASA